MKLHPEKMNREFIRGDKMYSIKDKVRHIMEKKDYSYADLAIRTGLPKSTLQNIGCGQTTRVAFIVCEKIAKASNVDVRYFKSDVPVDSEYVK